MAVLRALVLVADQEADRGAGGAALVHARKNFHRVRFAPLRHMARASGLAPVELFLNVFIFQFKPWRTTVHYAAIRGAVRLAERGHAVEKPEGIARHREIIS
jgi:hypothetical protein